MIDKLNGQKEYTIVKELHRGGFGITYLAKGIVNDGNIPHECNYTIKELFISKYCKRNPDNSVSTNSAVAEDTFLAAKKKFLEEARILHDLSHPNIVPVNEVFEQNGTAYYVMEYLGNTSLLQYVHDNGGCLSEENTIKIIKTVCDAVNHLHSNGILHLDIKPDNIMMFNGKPFLIDFGQAMFFKNGKAKGNCQIGGYTPGFSSAELRNGSVTTFRKDLDIYSVAATLYYMLTGEEPDDAVTISKKKIYVGLPDQTSDNICSAITSAMSSNVAERPSDINDFIGQLGAKGGTQTEVIINDSSNGFNKKIIYIAAGAVALALIVFGIVKMTGNQGPTPVVKRDTVTTVMVDTQKVAPVLLRKTVPQKTEPPKPTPSPNVHQGGTSNNGQLHTTETSGNGTVNLGYATWKGGIKGGKPHGNGTMTFTRSHSIDGCQEQALPGDYVKGFCENGILTNGALYRDGEKIESFIR